MRISFLIPTPNFLERVVPELEKLGIEVLVNRCDEKCDFIIGMSESQVDKIEHFTNTYPQIPLITYNWDWYNKDIKPEGYSPKWIQQMKNSREVWSASEITAIRCEKDTGIKSPVWFYAYIIPEEWGKTNDFHYALQSSRNSPQKRFDWFESACLENGIPYKVSHPNTHDRNTYRSLISNCAMLAVCSKDESLGTLSAMEAAYNKKPVIIADFPGALEVWGDDVFYFEKDNYENLVREMAYVWDNRSNQIVEQKVESAYRKVCDKFLPVNFATNIANRLKQL
jgi:hypothetical protein